MYYYYLYFWYRVIYTPINYFLLLTFIKIVYGNLCHTFYILRMVKYNNTILYFTVIRPADIISCHLQQYFYNILQFYGNTKFSKCLLDSKFMFFVIGKALGYTYLTRKNANIKCVNTTTIIIVVHSCAKCFFNQMLAMHNENIWCMV